MYVIWSLLLLVLLISLLDMYIAGQFYEEEHVKMSQLSVIKRWTRVGPKICVLRCRRNQHCQFAATEGNDCSLLDDSVGVKTDNGKEMLQVTVLKEIKNARKRAGNT